MGDLFHAATPQWQIENVLYEAKIAIRHTHIFLTKNPARYAEFNPWPKNCWLLTTITNQADADRRLPELMKAEALVRGISVEPLLEPIGFNRWFLPFFDWLIIGAMTGPGAAQHQPYPARVQSLIDQGLAADVPVFLKDNLKWPVKIQEFPK